MILRLLNVQGIAGLAASAILLCLLLVQKGETRHWRNQATRYERLYRAEQIAHATTVGNYRAAAEAARAADRAAAARVAERQRDISERTVDDYEKRLAAARAAANRLQRQSAAAPADPGAGRTAAMPAAGAGPGAIAEAAEDHRFSVGSEDLNWRLIATEQAIQLDALIKWVRAQSALNPNAEGAIPATSAGGAPRS